MEYCKGFQRLVYDEKWDEDFIGYGNPDADILILGQEAACKEGSKDWEKFYQPNRFQWEQILLSGKEIEPRNWDGISEYSFPDFFNPSFPFYRQKNTIRRYVKNKATGEATSNGGTSSTWYWYQRLISYVYPNDSGYVDMFDHIFISELNGHARPNHRTKQDVENNIRHRLDIMRATNYYWSHFKVVIFACGKYSEKIAPDKALLKSIFGDAQLYFCSQLSMNNAKHDVDSIGPELKNYL